jgi:hypothetical protein
MAMGGAAAIKRCFPAFFTFRHAAGCLRQLRMDIGIDIGAIAFAVPPQVRVLG